MWGFIRETASPAFSAFLGLWFEPIWNIGPRPSKEEYSYQNMPCYDQLEMITGMLNMMRRTNIFEEKKTYFE